MISQAQFLPLQAKVNSVKKDDQSVPLHPWYDRLHSTYPVLLLVGVKILPILCNALNTFSDFILKIRFQSIYSIFMQYLHTQWTTRTELCLDLTGPLATAELSSEEFCKFVEAIIYILCYINKCSW